MANKYYLARDDGETWGPFVDADSAIKWGVKELGDDPDVLLDGEPKRFYDTAVELLSWLTSMQERAVTYSSMEYGSWLTEAKRLIQEVDWIIYGVEFVVDAPPEQTRGQGVMNFLWSADLLHDPNV